MCIKLFVTVLKIDNPVRIIFQNRLTQMYDQYIMSYKIDFVYK